MEELASEEEAATTMGAGVDESPLTATVEDSEESGTDGIPRGPESGRATLAMSHLQTSTRQEREAAMGQKPRQGRGLPAGGKTRPASPMEWEAERGSARAT